MTIKEILEKYRGKLDLLDAEVLIAHSLKKSKEFLLTYPEHEISTRESSAINKLMQRRLSNEPIAQIVGHKEFYGLDFIVNKHTLVPRPETELMVEQAIKEISNFKLKISNSISIVDVGTGSGCIIISIAHELEKDTRYIRQLAERNSKYYALDISSEALKIAKKNAKNHDLNKKIKFTQGDLLSPLIENCKLKIENSTMIIVANLPYLSKEIYDSTPVDVKKFEPKSALYSAEAGLAHYRKLFQQLKILMDDDAAQHVIAFLEISPEQKTSITKLIKDILPSAKIEMIKDLTGRWRICKISI